MFDASRASPDTMARSTAANGWLVATPDEDIGPVRVGNLSPRAPVALVAPLARVEVANNL